MGCYLNIRHRVRANQPLGILQVYPLWISKRAANKAQSSIDDDEAVTYRMLERGMQFLFIDFLL